MSIKSNGDFTTPELIETDNLITNANHEFGDNTNFTSFNQGWSETEQAWGHSGRYHNVFLSDYIPVQGNGLDTFDQYKIECEIKQSPLTGNREYFLIVCYDKYKQFIENKEVTENSINSYSTAEARTTLAQTLNPGDTQVHLVDGSKWYVGTAGVYYHRKQMAVFPPEYEYPDYTYSDYDARYVTISGNVLTLQSPWTGPTCPAGCAIMNTRDGGTYSYIGGSDYGTADWKYRTGTSTATQNDGSMRAGTEYIRVGWLINYGSNTTTSTTYIRNIKLTNVTKGQVMRIGKIDAKFEEFDEVTGTTNGSVAQIKQGTLYINGEFIEE